MTKLQKLMIILSYYQLRLELGNEVCLTTSLDCSYQMTVKYTKDCTVEDILHEVGHYISLQKRISPWWLIPSYIRQKWRDDTLTGKWLSVCEEAHAAEESIANAIAADIGKLL